MPRSSTAIGLKALGGTWEWVGSDRNAGIWHEGLSCEADRWGPSKASFALKRSPAAAFPDLGAFTDVEITDNGVPVWSGRISETPTSDAQHSVSVQCDGWQYHLDDDVYSRQYLHTKLADYKDQRGMPSAVLGSGSLTTAGQVTADGNGVYLGFPNGTTLAVGTGVAAVLDLGDGCTGKRIVASWESSNNVPSMDVLVIGADYPGNSYAAGTFDTAITFANNAGTGGTNSGTLTTARRYIHLVMYLVSAPGALPFDAFVKFTGVAVFADTAYESANASLITASTIVGDALDRGTILLNTDRSLITATSFVFPAFGSTEPKTPREIINAVAATGFDSTHDAMTQVDVYRRMVFAPQPTVAAFEIGAWSGAPVDDASANSGDEIYSRVIVTGQSADGLQLSEATAANDIATGAGSGVPITSPAATNPSFATNTTGWTAGTGTSITRDTGVFDTTPASGRWERAASTVLQVGDTLTTTFTGTFLAGVQYQLTMLAKSTTALGTFLRAVWGVPGVDALVGGVWALTTSFAQAGATWTPTATRTSVTLSFTVQPGAPGRVYIDSLNLMAATPTLVDKRGFRRTKVLSVSNELIPTLADQIGATFLGGHMTTPFKGSTRVQGRGAIRDVLTGQSIAPSWMLLHTEKMLRLSHRIDPNTGGLWRDGRIVNAKWNAESDSVDLTLDSSRTSFDALLARLAIVVGGG